MSNTIRLIFFFLSFAAGISFATETGTLEIVLSGYANTNGVLVVALFDNAKAFGDMQGIAVAHVNVRPLPGGTTKAVFKDLPMRKYACLVYHDANGDGKLAHGLFGYPLEGFGASNHSDGKLFIPAYEKSLFLFDKDGMPLPVRIVYFAGGRKK
jgi:uncharacterized protein (DUF2141 family)